MQVKQQAVVTYFKIDPKVEDLLFPAFYSKLISESSQETAVILREGLEFLSELQNRKISYCGRIFVKGVPEVSQIFHSLSPEHLGVHAVSLFAIKCDQLVSTFDNGIEFIFRMIGKETCGSLKFYGPLIFQTGLKENPDLVFLIIPCGNNSHLIEALNLSPRGISLKFTTWAANLFYLLPWLFNIFAARAFEEDLRVFNQAVKIEDLLQIFKQNLEESSTPNKAIRSIYSRKFIRKDRHCLVSPGFFKKANKLGLKHTYRYY